jgi:hypothetical protein
MKIFISPDEKLEIAIQALEDICHPLDALHRGLKDGEQLNGLACQIIRDPSWLQSMASEALTKISLAE